MKTKPDANPIAIGMQDAKLTWFFCIWVQHTLVVF